VEDSRAELTEKEAVAFFARFVQAAQVHGKCKAGGQPTAADAQAVAAVVTELYRELEFRPSTASSASAAPAAASHRSSSASEPLRAAQCQCCFADWDNETKPVVVDTCGHGSFCADCFQQHLSIKIKDEAVSPWLGCPSAGCRFPLSAPLLLAHTTPAQQAHLAVIYMRKRLVRAANECFVSCQTRDCPFGFVVECSASGKAPKPKQQTCVLCSKAQMVEKGKEGELDDGFKEMINNGTIRPCPKCKHLTMKEFGVCNVIQCVKCSIWWNWNSRETGKDSMTLKNKARMSGTLWGAGELAFQQNLERTNPKAFRELLERNGQKWDPNYVRGTG